MVGILGGPEERLLEHGVERPVVLLELRQFRQRFMEFFRERFAPFFPLRAARVRALQSMSAEAPVAMTLTVRATKPERRRETRRCATVLPRPSSPVTRREKRRGPEGVYGQFAGSFGRVAVNRKAQLFV